MDKGDDPVNLVPWNPFRDLDLGREMSSFLENSPFSFLGRHSSPRVDVYQTEKEVIIKAEIPGVSKDDLDVFIDENSIRLSEQTRKDERYKDENMYRSERFYGSFARAIPLPAEVKPDQARAEYKEGILSVIIPRMEPSKMKGRRIDIQ